MTNLRRIGLQTSEFTLKQLDPNCRDTNSLWCMEIWKYGNSMKWPVHVAWKWLKLISQAPICNGNPCYHLSMSRRFCIWLWLKVLPAQCRNAKGQLRANLLMPSHTVRYAVNSGFKVFVWSCAQQAYATYENISLYQSTSANVWLMFKKSLALLTLVQTPRRPLFGRRCAPVAWRSRSPGRTLWMKLCTSLTVVTLAYPRCCSSTWNRITRRWRATKVNAWKHWRSWNGSWHTPHKVNFRHHDLRPCGRCLTSSLHPNLNWSGQLKALSTDLVKSGAPTLLKARRSLKSEPAVLVSQLEACAKAAKWLDDAFGIVL